MNTLATVVNLIGRAWAVAADGTRRELNIGDRLRGDEMLVTEPGARVDLDFGNNQQLTFLGEQQQGIAEAAQSVPDQLPTSSPRTVADERTQPESGAQRGLGEPEGHNFVQLVRIQEIIEADGITPLTVARIQEVLRPLGMSLPERVYELDEWREHRGGHERHETGPAARTPGLTIELQGAGPDGVYNAEEIGPDGTVPAKITLDDRVREGDRLVVKDSKGNTLIDRPVTVEDLREGVIVEVPVEPGDRDVTVEASITTPQGSSSNDRDEKPVDTLPPELVTALPPRDNEDSDLVNVDLSSHFKDNNPGPLTYEVEGLPPGLSYDPKTGKITGTVDKSGSQGGPGGDGEYPIKVTVTDPAGNSSTSTFPWTVTNPPPVATDDSQTIDEDTTATGNLITGTNSTGSGGGPDNDPDGDELKVTGFTVGGTTYQPGQTATITDADGPVGTITIDENGNYTFTPAQDWNGTVPDIGYIISDGEGGTSNAKLTITVTPVNDAPVAITPSAPLDQVNKDADSIVGTTEVVLALPSLFSDVDGDTLTYTVDGLPKGLVFDPITGVISGTIDRSASQEGDSGVHTVTITATDSHGATAKQNFTWTVTNPEPGAIDDAGTTKKTIPLSVTAADGVLDNDKDPDGDPIKVSGVTYTTLDGAGNEVSETKNPGESIKGKYGTLTLEEDGSYTYIPDLSDDDVRTLPEDGELEDVFTYQISDGEGGFATAELKITIQGHSSNPPLIQPEDMNGNSIDGQLTVYEKGLINGTEPKSDAHKEDGKIHIGALDGLNHVLVGTGSGRLIIEKDDFEAIAENSWDFEANPLTYTDGNGTLTVAGFDPIWIELDPIGNPGVWQLSGGALHYTYELAAKQNHPAGEGTNNATVGINLTVVDDQTANSTPGQVAGTGTLTINVIDDVPVAYDDANSVDVGGTTTSGNVIGGEGVSASADDKPDTTGADGATVTGIASNNISGNSATDNSGVLEIEGEYGTLNIRPDGSYDYERFEQSPGRVGEFTDIFTYTLTDGDGDPVTATLTITGVDSPVTVTVPDPTDPNDPNYPVDSYPADPDDRALTNISDLVVFESGLPTGSEGNGTDAIDNLVKVESSFTLTALDGLDDSKALVLSVGGSTLELTKAEVEGLATPGKSIKTAYGELNLSGYAHDPDTGVITISYEYILTSAPDNTETGYTGEHAFDRITITAKDRDGDSDERILSIKIIDDTPTAADQTPVTLAEGGNTVGYMANNSATGGENLLVNDTQGADAARVYQISYIDVSGDTQIAPITEGSSVTVITYDGGELTVDSNGDWQYTSPAVSDTDTSAGHGLPGSTTDGVTSADFDYNLIDRDGDISNWATQPINVTDTVPEVGTGANGPANASVDEKHLSTGTDPAAGALTVGGTLGVIKAADGITTAFETDLGYLYGLGLKSNGEELKYNIVDGKLVATTQGGQPVFTVAIIDGNIPSAGTAGARYTFTLQGPLDHYDATNADLQINIPFQFVVTDADGDTADGSFTVTVTDDPPPTTGGEEELIFDEEDVGVFLTPANAGGPGAEITIPHDAEPGAPKFGTVTIDPATGNLTYTPTDEDNFSGEDSFTYTYTPPGSSTPVTTTVKVTVNPKADAPELEDNKDIWVYEDGIAQGAEGPGGDNTATGLVDLDLKMPVITDDEQVLGAGNFDYPERLGEITLSLQKLENSVLPEETKLVYTKAGEGSPTDLVENGSGGYTIVIVTASGDTNSIDTELHHSGELATVNVNYLTEAEYQSIQAQLEEHRHENFEVVVKVSSYEVNGEGEQLANHEVAGTNGAESTQIITVEVRAVTDPVSLHLQEGVAQTDVTVALESDKVANITFDEDTAFNLTQLLNPGAFKDLDGSETRYLGFDGLPEGTVVTVGGESYTIGDENVPTYEYKGEAVPAISIPGNQPSLPVVTIQPPKDFSGDIKNIKVILAAVDSDDDSSHTPLVVADEVTLNLYVKPVGGDVAAGDVRTDEDTAVSFMEEVRVTDTGTGSEIITEVEFTLPTGWSLVGEPTIGKGSDWEITGTGTGPFTIKALGETNLQSVLKDFTIQPPAHSSKDETITVKVTSTDTNTVNGSSVSNTDNKELTIKVEVTPVAERIKGKGDADPVDTDGDGNADLSMNGNHEYQAAGEEDQWFKLGEEDSFKLSADWSNEDGKWVRDGSGNWSQDNSGAPSEDTFALLTPYKTKDNDAQANAETDGMLEGSEFVYVEGTGKVNVKEDGTLEVIGGTGKIVTVPFAGEPVQIPMQYLDSVQFKGPKDWSGVVKIKVEAGTIDYDEDYNTPTPLEISGEAWLTNLIVEPRADQVTLTVNPTIKTDEDIPTELYIQPVSTEGETFDITISGIPVGATITYWVPKSNGEGYDARTFTATSGNTVLEINGFDASKQPTLTPPKDSNDPINLSVKAESVDTLEYINKDGQKVVIIQKGKNKTTLTYDKDSPDNLLTEETVELVGVEDTSHTLPIQIEVQGVPDRPVLDLWQDFDQDDAKLDESADRNYKVYEEDDSADQSGAPSLKVALNDLIKEIKSDETGVNNAGPDGSESITLRIADLPQGFTLEGAGPVLPGGVWVIQAGDLDKVSIVVPEHYSGTVEFTVQPVVTENDNLSETFFDKQNVSFKVKPVVDSTLSDSTDNLSEDTIGKLNLSTVNTNGDDDEYISQVRIKVSEVEAKGLTLYASEDGTAQPTVVDGYYVFRASEGQKAPEVWVKGPANHSGEIKLDIEYTVTDPVGDDSTDIDSATKTGTVEHTLTFAPVTDEIKIKTLGDGDITGVDSADISTTGGVTTLTNPGTVKVSLTVQQQDDNNADGKTDIDGSEQLTHVVVTGVPEGVSVKNAIETGPGQWLLIVEDKKWNGSADLGQELEFVVSQYAAEFGEAKPITITTYSKDSGAESYKKDSITWQLDFKRTGEDPDENNLPQVEINPVEDPRGAEDTAFSLNQVVSASIDESALTGYNVTLTVRTKPDDGVLVSLAEEASGITFVQTEVMEGEELVVLWTATKQVGSGETGQDVLEQLLEKVQVTAPENDNSNNMEGPLELDINLSVHADGISRDDSAKPEVEITPVTDTIDISVGSSVTEGEPIPLNISLPGETVDGELGNEKGWEIDGLVFIHIADGTLAGELRDSDGNTLEVYSGTGQPDGTPTNGKLYAVAADKLDGLQFVPDTVNHPHQTGSLDVTVLVQHQEKNSADAKVSAGTGKIEIVQSNSGYEAEVTATGNELQNSAGERIKLVFENAGLVDEQETIHSAFIDGLPSGFTVWVGDTMASNGGGGVWVVPVEDGELPTDISVKPPKNWSGTLEGWDETNNPNGIKLTVMSGHEGLEPTPSDIGFDLMVNPVPDGVEFEPTPSFGNAGDKINLNLNVAMKDPSAATGSKDAEENPTDQHTERTELTLTGFPDGQKVMFFVGGEEVTVVANADDIDNWNMPTAYFDGGTWTLTGLSQADLNNLSFLHAETEGVKQVTVSGKTYEVGADGQPFKVGESINYSGQSTEKPVNINVSPTVPTSGADHFLWIDGELINGFGGDDTIQLRFADNLDHDDFGKLKNIEIIDMSGEGSGQNSITSLTAKDVLDMTDGANVLRINGTGGDKVTLGVWDPDENVEGDEVKWNPKVFGDGEGVTGYDVYTAAIGTQIVTLEIQTNITIIE